jgi:hypothetical protein
MKSMRGQIIFTQSEDKSIDKRKDLLAVLHFPGYTSQPNFHLINPRFDGLG